MMAGLESGRKMGTASLWNNQRIQMPPFCEILPLMKSNRPKFMFLDMITKFALAVLFTMMLEATIYAENLITLLPFLVVFITLLPCLLIFTKLLNSRQTGCKIDLKWCSENLEDIDLKFSEKLQDKYGMSKKIKALKGFLLFEKDGELSQLVWDGDGNYFLIGDYFNIRYCRGKAVVARLMRSAAPKDKDNEPENSTLPNQTGNAPATFDIEGGAISTAMNSSPTNVTVNYAEGSSGNEFGTSGSQSVNQTPPHDDDGGVNESTPPNDYRLDEDGLETVFTVASQILSTMSAVWANNNKSEMPSAAKYLRYVLLSCIFLSLISSFYIKFLFGHGRWRRSIAARIVRGIARVSTALALLTATGLHLPNHLMLWGTLGAYFVSMPAIIGYAMKK